MKKENKKGKAKKKKCSAERFDCKLQHLFAREDFFSGHLRAYQQGLCFQPHHSVGRGQYSGALRYGERKSVQMNAWIFEQSKDVNWDSGPPLARTTQRYEERAETTNSSVTNARAKREYEYTAALEVQMAKNRMQWESITEFGA
eukprot:IDg2903t1